MTKPGPASRDFRIWGTSGSPDFNPTIQERSETSEALSVPKRRATKEEARRASLRLEIEESVKRRAPMKNIRGDSPLYEP